MARLALNLFSILDFRAPISRTTIEQHFAKAIDSMAEAFRRSPCSPSLLGPRYWQCTLEQKMTANLDKRMCFTQAAKIISTAIVPPMFLHDKCREAQSLDSAKLDDSYKPYAHRPLWPESNTLRK